MGYKYGILEKIRDWQDGTCEECGRHSKVTACVHCQKSLCNDCFFTKDCK